MTYTGMPQALEEQLIERGLKATVDLMREEVDKLAVAGPEETLNWLARNYSNWEIDALMDYLRDIF